MPKRLEAALKLFEFFFLDYTTIVLSLILLVTLWRSINTYEILSNHFKVRFAKDEQERHFYETFVKDKKLITQIVNEL